jgi:DNA-directed RNA polymerase specialized sigma subunit
MFESTLEPEQSNMLEPEFGSIYSSWKQTPSPQTTGAMLRALQPVLDKGITAYAGRDRSALTQGYARRIALQALQTYDPSRATLKTHVMNHLQGLRRATGKFQNIVKFPERAALDQNFVVHARRTLADELGREPSIEELADHTGLSPRRLQRLQKFRGAMATGMLDRFSNGEGGGFNPAVVTDNSRNILDVVYGDLNPVNQKILEWSLGLHGEPVLPNHDIARRLGLSPGAISQRRAQIQTQIDNAHDLRLFGP